MNRCLPHNRPSKYMKKKLIELKGKSSKCTITGGDFNTPPSTTDRTIRLKFSKDVKELNTLNQKDVINIYRAVHPTAVNTNYFQVPMEHIPKQTISLVIKQTLPYYQTKLKIT